MAGLSLLGLTACSSDDAANDAYQPGSLLVTMDELEYEDDFGSTRSYLSRDLKSHLWVEVDSMRVYDNDLFKYDMYKFNWNDDTHHYGVFGRTHEASFIQEAKWALYPKNDVSSGHWGMDEKTGDTYIEAWMRICTVLDPDEDNPVPYQVPLKFNQVLIDDIKPVYADRLPRWGEVTSVDGGNKLTTNLSYLTGVLRLQLAGTQGKAGLLKIQMFHGDQALPIAGEFKAKLSINNVKQVAELATESYAQGSGSDHIIVDLSEATGSIVVYVPLVTTKVPVDIVASASNDGGQTWTEFKRFKDKTVKRGKVYGNSTEYIFQ